jgi:hypothetical protein
LRQSAFIPGPIWYRLGILQKTGVAAMKISLLPWALPLLLLAGCGQPAPQGNNATPAPTPGAADDYLARINRLPPRQRDTVMFRAIDDAGLDCQGVIGSAPREAVAGRPAWTAPCDNKRTYVVVLQPGGIMQVLGADDGKKGS